MDWNIDWNGEMDYGMDLDGTFLCTADGTIFNVYILAIAFQSVRPWGGGMDASQCKAELTLSRLVSKYPLDRALHYSETMILKYSLVHFVVHQHFPVQRLETPSVSMPKHKIRNQSLLCQQ